MFALLSLAAASQAQQMYTYGKPASLAAYNFANEWQPSASFTAMGSASSTGALTTQPMLTTGALTTQPMLTTGLTQQTSWVPQASYSATTSASSTGAYVAPAVQMQATQMYMSSDVGSHNNPYNVQQLGVGKLIGRTMAQNKGVVQQMNLGEKHVVNNDLKILENHEVDKTIFTKKVVHHSPVLHKTIRTHEIAEDTVNDKLVHHMNTVKDQFKKVPGNAYQGGEQHVDHTTAIEPAPQVVAQDTSSISGAAPFVADSMYNKIY